MIKIRPIDIKDTDQIIEWRNSKHVMDVFIQRTPLTKDMHLNWIKEKVKGGKVYQFIAEEDNTPFGTTYIKDIDEEHQKAELGIFIGDLRYINRGLGTQIVNLTLKYGFEKLNLNKIYARVLSYNMPSYHMFIKLGFNRDAILREDVKIEGKYHDVFIMSILKDDYYSINKTKWF